MHRMRWPSLFICCGGDQLSPAGKYLSSCHSETSPQTGRGNPHFLAVDAQVPSSEWERQRVCCCVNSLFRRNLDHSSCTLGRKSRNHRCLAALLPTFPAIGKSRPPEARSCRSYPPKRKFTKRERIPTISLRSGSE